MVRVTNTHLARGALLAFIGLWLGFGYWYWYERPPQRTQAQTKAPPTSLVGLHVVSAEGSRVGYVSSVRTDRVGGVNAIRIQTGGFLGIGTTPREVPTSKFSKAGNRVQLNLTVDQVNKLPAVKD